MFTSFAVIQIHTYILNYNIRIVLFNHVWLSKTSKRVINNYNP